MKMKYAFLLLGGAVLSGCASRTATSTAAEKREILAVHETRAEFLGVEEHVCRGLTALCPDRCGHSGSLARFRVVEYINFESFSEYGKKQERFQFLIKDNMGTVKVDIMLAEAIERLSPGDIVLLSWNHDYVTKEGSSYPERPVTKLGRDFRE
jgi:hypothetical protein